jgi:hypothetical protein
LSSTTERIKERSFIEFNKGLIRPANLNGDRSLFIRTLSKWQNLNLVQSIKLDFKPARHFLPIIPNQYRSFHKRPKFAGHLRLYDQALADHVYAGLEIERVLELEEGAVLEIGLEAGEGDLFYGDCQFQLSNCNLKSHYNQKKLKI